MARVSVIECVSFWVRMPVILVSTTQEARGCCLLEADCFCGVGAARAQPVGNQCCGWTSPHGSYCVCKKPFSKGLQETLKKIKIYYLQDLEIA